MTDPDPVCVDCGHPVSAHDYASAWRAFVCTECKCIGYDPEHEDLTLVNAPPLPTYHDSDFA